MAVEQSASAKSRQSGHLLPNLLFNIVVPTLILTKFSGDDQLGPAWGIVVALAFPVAYGVYDWIKAGKTNFFSILGVVSVLLTGTMSLLKLPPEYIAIKEASIPALLGLATLISTFTRYPLIRTLLFNEQVMQVEKVHAALDEKQSMAAFERKLVNASYMITGSFTLSAVLNYVLAKVVLVSEPGTPAFAEELGKMTALSFPVIALPSTLVLMGALYYLIHNIQKLTALELEDIFNTL